MTPLIQCVAAVFLIAAALQGGIAVASPTEPTAVSPAPDPASPAGTTQVAPGPIDDELTPDLRRIQENLGGPVINQFPSLTPSPAPTPPRTYATPDAAAPSPAVRTERNSTVRILREVAAQLEQAANRLEDLELYRQADGLRDQAQRLRVDARSLAGAPSDGGAISPAPPWQAPTSTPTPTPSAPLRYGFDPPRATVEPSQQQTPDPIPAWSWPSSTPRYGFEPPRATVEPLQLRTQVTPGAPVEPQPEPEPRAADSPDKAERQ